MFKLSENIVSIDCEVSPALSYHYDFWDASILHTVEHQALMSFSYAKGDGKVKCVKLDDFELFETEPHNDLEVVKALHKVLDEADIVSGHNSIRFDSKMANRFFIKHNLPPVRPYKQIDTLQIAKKVAKFHRNGLDPLNIYLGLKGKTDLKVGDLWKDCWVNNDRKAYKNLAKYNNQDVVAQRDLLRKLLPYDNTLSVNIARLSDKEDACPRCGAEMVEGNFQRRGYRHTKVSKFRQYQCNCCRGWFSSRVAESVNDDVKPKYV